MQPESGSREQDDTTLIDACRRGDERAWDTLVERYRRLVYSVPVVAFRMAQPDADEIFQRVMVKLFEHIGGLRSSASLPAWLVTVARNECTKFVRIARRWRPVDDTGTRHLRDEPADVVGMLHRVECEHRLRLALERLDGAARELLSMLYLEDPTPSYAQIARRLDRPVGSLGPTHARSLKKLRGAYLELGGSNADTRDLASDRSPDHPATLLSRALAG